MITILVIFSLFFLFLGYQQFQLVNSTHLLNPQEHQEQLLQEKNAFLNTLDLVSDDSLHKYVDNKVSFRDVTYIPENLVSIAGEYIYDSKGNSQLRLEANQALQEMSEDFFAEFEKKLVVVSAYRSYLYQKGIKDRGCPDNLCAKAGYSEHQSGLGVDFFSASTQQIWLNSPSLSQYYIWLAEHAHLYGFHNTYQRGVETDGYEIEPWHWRYVGIPFATYLWEQDATFAEWIVGR